MLDALACCRPFLIASHFPHLQKTVLAHTFLMVNRAHIPRRKRSTPNAAHNFPREAFCSISALHFNALLQLPFIVTRLAMVNRMGCTSIFCHDSRKLEELEAFFFTLVITCAGPSVARRLHSGRSLAPPLLPRPPPPFFCPIQLVSGGAETSSCVSVKLYTYYSSSLLDLGLDSVVLCLHPSSLEWTGSYFSDLWPKVSLCEQ